jgi:hypothetical protein
MFSGHPLTRVRRVFHGLCEAPQAPLRH